MNDRIRLLRNTLGLTAEAFGDAIGIVRSAVSNIETGRRQPTNQLVNSICREFDVNEAWLRTGEGEMFLPKDPDDELSEFMGAVLREDIRTSVRKQLVDLIAHLPPEVLHAIAQVARERAALYRETLPPNNKEG